MFPCNCNRGCNLRNHGLIVIGFDKQLGMCKKKNDDTLTSGKSGILIGFGTMNVQHNHTP